MNKDIVVVACVALCTAAAAAAVAPLVDISTEDFGQRRGMIMG